MLRHRPAELQCVLTEHRTGGTPVLARARLAHVTAVVLPQHLGMRLGQPHRLGMRSRKRRSTAMPALPRLSMIRSSQPEIVHVSRGFDFRPGEDAHGYEVHSALTMRRTSRPRPPRATGRDCSRRRTRYGPAGPPTAEANDVLYVGSLSLFLSFVIEP